jgi:hypothetical protein
MSRCSKVRAQAGLYSMKYRRVIGPCSMCSPAGRYHHHRITLAGAPSLDSESLEDISEAVRLRMNNCFRLLGARFNFGRRPKKPRRSGATKWEETPSQRDHHSLAESSRCVHIDFAFIPHVRTLHDRGPRRSDAPQHLGNPRCPTRTLGPSSVHATPGDATHVSMTRPRRCANGESKACGVRYRTRPIR